MSNENTTHLTDSLGAAGLLLRALARIEEATLIFKPVYMAGALSGGGDSIAACFCASRAPNFRSMFHCNTGVGLQATEDYVEGVCQKMGWPLEVFRALENTRHDGTSDSQDYFKMVEEHGFPGPAKHWKMYQRLKQRQIEAFCRAHKKYHSRQVVMLVSGRRKQESARRNAKIVGPYEREGRVIWVNPLYDASKLDCTRIREMAGIPKSPVVDLIHMSGECLCGAFGHPDELKELKLWFSNDPTVKRLAAADDEARACGRPCWGWGRGPNAKTDAAKIKSAGAMCSSCDLKFAGHH